MESLLPALRTLISPHLKGKLYERQRNWMLVKKKIEKNAAAVTQTLICHCYYF